MEQAQSNKVTEKFRVNFMALVRSIFNLEMFSRGFQVLDSLLHSLLPLFLLVYIVSFVLFNLSEIILIVVHFRNHLSSPLLSY